MTLERTLEPEVMDTVEDAVDYDGMDHSAVNQLFAGDLLSFLNDHVRQSAAPSQRLIVDLGTGTIRIPLELCNQWPDAWPVAACDLSFEMLKLGLSHVRRSRRTDAICPVYCDAKRLPFASGSVAIVMSNSIVHHIPDPLFVFRETKRILAADGIVFFRDLLRPASTEDVERLVQLYAGDENQHSQQLFRESLHAALTVSEVDRLLVKADLWGLKAEQTSDRHWTIAGKLDPGRSTG